MCLLTYFPADVMPNVEALLKGARANSDGHGFAIVIPAKGDRKARILVRKSMKPDSLIKEFAFLRALYPAGPALFHSRITTDGDTGLFNCHPFMLSGDKRTVIGHNGILPSSVRPGKDDVRSDTRIFAEVAGSHFRLDTVLGRRLAGEWMGSFNKIVILSVDPAFTQDGHADYGYIVNEKEGIWEKGIWYSNSSFRGYRYTTIGTGGGFTYYEASGGTTRKYTWDWCSVKACTAQAATVSPYTGVCTVCKTCSLCDFCPCECKLMGESQQGKDGSLQWGSSGDGGTVIGGNSKSGNTGEWDEPDAATVEEYYAALDAAHRASLGEKVDGYVYDVDPEDDPADNSPGLLEDVINFVGHLNEGGDLEEWPPDSPARKALDRALEARLASLDTVIEELNDLEKRGDPADDQESLIQVLFDSGMESDNDQDYLVHDGVKYAVN
jgi:hypothetical protein